MSKPRKISDYPNRADDYETAVSKMHDQNTDIALDQGGDNEVTAEDIVGHIENEENPHGTTAGQVGAYTKAETDGLVGGQADRIDTAEDDIQALESNKADKNQVALPVPALPELLQVDPEEFGKALVSGYYEEGDTEKAVVWEWDADKPKADHDGWSCINPEHLAEIGSPEWYDPTGDGTDDEGNGVWVRKNKKALTVFDFGARDEEEYDNTHHFQTMADSVGYIGIPDSESPFEIDRIQTNRSVNIFGLSNNARVLLRETTSNNRQGFWIRHGRSHLTDIHILGNGRAGSAVTVDDADDSLIDFSVEGMRGTANTESWISALEVNNSDRVEFHVVAREFLSDDGVREDVPRGVSVQGTSSDYKGTIRTYNTGSGLVVGNSAGDGQIDLLYTEDCCGNSLYQLSNSVATLTIRDMYVVNKENPYGIVNEGIVTSGILFVNRFIYTGDGLFAISLWNGRKLHIDYAYIGELDDTVMFVRTRANSNFGDFSVDNLEINTTHVITFALTSDASVQSLSLPQSKIVMRYSPDLQSRSDVADFRACEQFHVENMDMSVIYDPSMTDTARYVRFASTRQSYFRNNRFRVLNPEDGSLRNHKIGVRGITRSSCSFVGVHLQANLATPDGRDESYLGGSVDGINLSPLIPQGGSYKIGTILYNSNSNNPSPVGWIYQSSGWVPLS